MNNGVVAALQRSVSDLIIVGDSRLAIQQSMGVIACKKDALQVGLARHKELTKKLNSVRYLHRRAAGESIREPQQTPTRRESVRNEAEFGGAQSQVSDDTAELLTELSEARTPDASDIDPLVVQAKRRQRISKAQDEEFRWADLKAYLKGEFTQLSHRRVHNAGKVADEFALSEDGLLYR
ncbi:unnamed protein product [Phytophthora fragariaefolia]|uniref:Unnamed protein product n=1 Tax=Phytophthora fragariaefolia TaxID=1490495 RepID=A0A9W6XY11_9STRA|nr:unnamed protein product [Phytophthora fragariaefolia]